MKKLSKKNLIKILEYFEKNKNINDTRRKKRIK